MFNKFTERGLNKIYFEAPLLSLHTLSLDEILFVQSLPKPTQLDYDLNLTFENHPNSSFQTQFLQPNTHNISSDYYHIFDDDLGHDSDDDGIESCIYHPYIPHEYP